MKDTRPLSVLTDAQLRRRRFRSYAAGDWEDARDVICEQAGRVCDRAVAGLRAVRGPASALRSAPHLSAEMTPWQRLTADLHDLPDVLTDSIRRQYPDVDSAHLHIELTRLLPTREADLLDPWF